MQWDDSEYAGFTDPDSTPWIGVNPNKETINVEAERDDPASVWHYYRDLISLRKEHDVIVYGDYDPLTPDHESLWAYTRTLGDDSLLVVLNFADEETTFEPPADLEGASAEVLIANYDVDAADVAAVALRPWEARVYHLG
jgi:glycosidase